MVSYYNKNQAVPEIIALLDEFGVDVCSENIKVWDRPTMAMINVVRGCNAVKRNESLNDVVVYTNKVPHKDYIEMVQMK